jgi:hypothetical protein
MVEEGLGNWVGVEVGGRFLLFLKLFDLLELGLVSLAEFLSTEF